MKPVKSKSSRDAARDSSESPKVDIKIRVTADERMEADAIAEMLGTTVGDVMRTCFKRFIREGGFPFPMTTAAPAATKWQRPVVEHVSRSSSYLPGFGVAAEELSAQMTAAFAAAESSNVHARAQPDLKRGKELERRERKQPS